MQRVIAQVVVVSRSGTRANFYEAMHEAFNVLYDAKEVGLTPHGKTIAFSSQRFAAVTFCAEVMLGVCQCNSDGQTGH